MAVAACTPVAERLRTGLLANEPSGRRPCRQGQMLSQRIVHWAHSANLSIGTNPAHDPRFRPLNKLLLL